MNKVYVVLVGYEYEGYTDNNMKVFLNEEDANKYADEIGKEYGDYIDVFEQEVE